MAVISAWVSSSDPPLVAALPSYSGDVPARQYSNAVNIAMVSSEKLASSSIRALPIECTLAFRLRKLLAQQAKWCFRGVSHFSHLPSLLRQEQKRPINGLLCRQILNRGNNGQEEYR